jgi:hypothetical protein
VIAKVSVLHDAYPGCEVNHRAPPVAANTSKTLAPQRKYHKVMPTADGDNPPLKDSHSCFGNKCNCNGVALTDNPPDGYALRLGSGLRIALLARRLT